jgi:hypothetical protein
MQPNAGKGLGVGESPWYGDGPSVLPKPLVDTPLAMHRLVLGHVGHDQRAAQPRVAGHLPQVHGEIQVLHLRRSRVALGRPQK